MLIKSHIFTTLSMIDPIWISVSNVVSGLGGTLRKVPVPLMAFLP